jgi:hypothetical protein
MKTSIVIPSTNNHFKYLDKVFLSYVKQTVRPEEMVVSVANGHLIRRENIDTLKAFQKVQTGVREPSWPQTNF